MAAKIFATNVPPTDCQLPHVEDTLPRRGDGNLYQHHDPMITVRLLSMFMTRVSVDKSVVAFGGFIRSRIVPAQGRKGVI